MKVIADGKPGCWAEGTLPDNVCIGPNSVIDGNQVFARYYARRERALTIGSHCTMDSVHFALGEEAQVEIGDYCYFLNVILMVELELRVGNHVLVGWNSAIIDSDFHPIAAAQRIADAVACSPLANGRPRQPFARARVIIEDDVYIGPNATILKGVRIGAGAFIEPGSLVTRDVPPRARMLGNPAQMIGEA